MGLSTSDAVAALQVQSEEFHRMASEARSSALQSCSTSEQPRLTRTLQAIDSGQPLPADAITFESMTGTYVKAYATAIWGKLGNDETAKQIACFARR